MCSAGSSLSARLGFHNPSLCINFDSSEVFASNKILVSESSHEFLQSIIARQMENACRSDKEESNSTEYIVSLKVARFKTQWFSGTPSCK